MLNCLFATGAVGGAVGGVAQPLDFGVIFDDDATIFDGVRGAARPPPCSATVFVMAHRTSIGVVSNRRTGLQCSSRTNPAPSTAYSCSGSGRASLPHSYTDARSQLASWRKLGNVALMPITWQLGGSSRTGDCASAHGMCRGAIDGAG